MPRIKGTKAEFPLIDKLYKSVDSCFSIQSKEISRSTLLAKSLKTKKVDKELLAKALNESFVRDTLLGVYNEELTKATPTVVRNISKIAKGINAHTIKLVSSKITKGIKDGLSENQLRRLVKAEFDSMRGYRSDRIARTEATRLKAFKTLEKTEANGFKRWITMGDERVRKSHKKYHRLGWIPVEQSFDKGIYYPPSGVNCRCWIQTKSWELPTLVKSPNTPLKRLEHFIQGRGFQ